MLENSIVYERMNEAFEKGMKCVIATVVKVYGSAYRPAGAKMYIDQDGITVGMISGGCLEGDVVEVAKEVMISGRPQMKKYNLDEDLVWGLGLGCPGEVVVYIELLNEIDN